MDPSELVHSTADAAFATGDGGRILVWNEAAEKLVGYKSAQVVGKPCHQILCGVDVFGNRWCDDKCNLSRMAARRESIRRFEMDVRSSTGQFLRVSVSVLTLLAPESSSHTLIHVLQPAAGGHERAPVALKHHAPDKRPNPLTRREVQVLRHLAAGAGSREIAEKLFISVATVRTHVQNILAKLDVRNKLAAVSVAIRDHLI